MTTAIQQPQTLEDCLNLQSHFIGIPRITKKNFKEFYRRGKTLQILGVGFLDEGRMPSLAEVEANINIPLSLPRGPQLNTPKWNKILISVLNDMTTALISTEENETSDDRPAATDSS